MSGIVCAIRGGPASRPTIEKAIETAQQTGLPIYFLYVLNMDFLMHTSQTQTGTLARELRELGEFILLTAQTRAEMRNATAHGVIKEGSVVRDEIIELSHEVNADYVVLGRPRETKEKNVFTSEILAEFSQRLEAETGAKVVFAAEETE